MSAITPGRGRFGPRRCTEREGGGSISLPEMRLRRGRRHPNGRKADTDAKREGATDPKGGACETAGDGGHGTRAGQKAGARAAAAGAPSEPRDSTANRVGSGGDAPKEHGAQELLHLGAATQHARAGGANGGEQRNKGEPKGSEGQGRRRGEGTRGACPPRGWWVGGWQCSLL